jgi:hypothetical protein
MKKIILFLILFIPQIFAGNLFSQTILEEAKKGNLKEIQMILQRDRSKLYSTDEVGYTPLHYALIRAKWDVALFLINEGSNVNTKGTEGGTPLHCAANHDNTEIIELLIKKGGEIEARNAWGNTPLNLASMRGCEETIKTLIALGADVNTSSNEGWTPLHYAYQSGHVSAQKALIEAGASEIVKDKSGKTPCEYATQRPAPIEIKNKNLEQYVGDYNMGPAGFIPITMENEQLMMEDFAVDPIYPIAFDEFYHSREPWRVRFYRNVNGEVDKVVIDVQRNTMVGKKVKSRFETVQKPLMGIKSRNLTREDISDEVLKQLFFDLKSSSNTILVTYIQEKSASHSAGIQVKDIIIEFNNKPLKDPGDLQRLLLDVKPNSIVPIKIVRGVEVINLNLDFKQ